MSKINQLQQALLEMDGGEFQKLADAYLVEKGLGHVNSIGSVAAANKVRTGTPDSLLTTPQGKYIFAEHTTQQANLREKMSDDLEKCFNESKTGIPVDKIEQVAFCFTGKISAKDEYKLSRICDSKNVGISLYGIDAIAFDIYGKYPGLARDFLDIEIDSGQIVSPERFVSLYNSSKLATPLDLRFHFREEELNNLLSSLETEELTFLTGKAGVGKSRLALEACRKFNEHHPEYEIFCVLGRNRDLWNDLQTRFRRPGHYLIFVDDANRVSSFDYVVDLLQYQSDEQHIKVVATVRDYAITKVEDASRHLERYARIELESFKEEQIKTLIGNEFGISNYHYLERIAEIAQGNPRLAVMSAEVAKEGPLSSIHDVSALYDNYFYSIRKDLQVDDTDLKSADILKVAAIISFFKAVDRSNHEMMTLIETVLNITPSVFWEATVHLHELELLDMYEDEVVRVSDQVLGTYLFYLAVFKEKTLDFGVLLDSFFPKYQHRLIDSINPVMSAFNSELIEESMRPHIERVWAQLEEVGNDDDLLQLIDVFGIIKRTDTLLWLNSRIEELELSNVEQASITFEKSTQAIPSPSILSVIRSFAFAEEQEVRMALELLMRYLIKRPCDAPKLLLILIDDFGFRPESYQWGYNIQHSVVDAIYRNINNEDTLFSRFFLALASGYLGCNFENSKMKGMVLHTCRFSLVATPELASLRKSIWQKLLTLYEDEIIRGEVLRVLREYNESISRATNMDIVKYDAEYVLSFIENKLDPDCYSHCVIVHNYFDTMERLEIDVSEELRDKYNNDVFSIAELLFPKWREKSDLELTHEEYEKYKQSRWGTYIANYEFHDYVKFFESCREIREGLEESHHNLFQLQRGIEDVLLVLANLNIDLFVSVLEYYIELKDPFQLSGYPLVRKLLEQRGFDGAIELLSRQDYPTKRKWQLYTYEAISEDSLNNEMLERLLLLYETAEWWALPSNLDYLLKYTSLDSRIVARVVSTVLSRTAEDSNFVHALTMLFNPYTQTFKRVNDLFSLDFDVLKKAYFVLDGSGEYVDHDGKMFGLLLNADLNFSTEYINWKYTNAKYGSLSSHDDNRDYSFIWPRSDYSNVMDSLFKSTFQNEKDRHYRVSPYIEVFFNTKSIDGDSGIQEKQDKYLMNLIEEHHQDVDLLEYVFVLITTFPEERRLQFVQRFVELNQSIDMFKKLPIEPNSWSSNGTWVPVLQKRLEYFESLLPIMNKVTLLRQKRHIEQLMDGLRSELESEKKRDFLRD